MKKKRPSKTFSPLGNSTVEICKNLLAFRAELTRSPDELKTTANEILRVLAKDVLLSQVHQGRPIESADIGAFDCFYAAQEKPPHIYLTLIQVSGWASPDDDPTRNSEMISGPHTEGFVKDGSLYVSLLKDTKVSRFYLGEASIPEDVETLPLLRGDPIPVIAGPCSTADLWCALQEHGRVARLPDTLRKRGWQSAMLAIFQMGDGSTGKSRSRPSRRSLPAEKKKQLKPKSEDDSQDEHERMAKALGLKGEQFERHVHSHRHPAFNGSFTFDITFELLGGRVRRKVRVVYECTPEGEYFDLIKNALFNGWGNSSYFLELQGWEEGEDGKKRKAVWRRSDVNDVFLTEKLSWKIFDLIDEECERLDQKRRKKAKLPAPKR